MSETALITVSAKEGFLRSLIAGGAVEKLIPEDASPEDVLLRLRVCVGADKELGRIGGRVSLAIGRCLGLAQERPEIWQEANYKTFGAFVDAEAKRSGKSHGTAWGDLKMDTAFKGISLENYVPGHITNVRTAAYLLPPDASEKQKLEALELTKLSVEEFRPELERRLGMARGAADYGEVKLIGNNAQASEIKEWLADRGAQEWAGSSHPIEMILSALHSASTEIEETEAGIPEGHPAADLGWEETLG